MDRGEGIRLNAVEVLASAFCLCDSILERRVAEFPVVIIINRHTKNAIFCHFFDVGCLTGALRSRQIFRQVFREAVGWIVVGHFLSFLKKGYQFAPAIYMGIHVPVYDERALMYFLRLVRVKEDDL